MKLWKIISFTTDELQNTNKNPATLVPFRTLVHTLPLAFSYLLYMVCIQWHMIVKHFFPWVENVIF